MVMLLAFYLFILFGCLYLVLDYKNFILPGRIPIISGAAPSIIDSLFPSGSSSMSISNMLGGLFFFLLVSSLLCNIPLFSVGSMYYFWTCTLSLIYWVGLMLVVFYTQAKSFMAHMLPYASPSGLMLFLPLVEIFSQIIRPFTLMVRISTNLSSGHIMLFMFSYFSLAGGVGMFLVGGFMLFLMVLELFISLLQAYIFSSLSYLYASETLLSRSMMIALDFHSSGPCKSRDKTDVV